MINSIQSPSFTAAKAMDKVTPELMKSPGSYTSNPITQSIIDDLREEEKKKSSFAGKLFKLILTAGVVAGAMVVLRKTAFKDVIPKTADELKAESAKPMERVKNALIRTSDKIEDFFKNMYNKMFKKKDASKTGANNETKNDVKTDTKTEDTKTK